MKNLPYYPTVSWGSHKNERWSSLIHYDNGNGRTLCGLHIPHGRPQSDSWDMCETCIKNQNKKDTPK